MRALLLVSLSAVLASPALGQDDSFLRCRGVADAAARLACYDALPVPAARPAPAAPVVAAAVPVAAAVAKPLPRPADSFGLPQRAAEPQEAVSAVGASFSGWGPNQRIRLENGQVWQVTDGSSVALAEGRRKVTVKRGALNSFYLDIEGLNTSPRVRRVE